METLSFRKYVIGSIFIFVFLTLLVKLFFLQVVNTDYKLSAENISQRVITQYPARGLLYDRNGELLVANQPVYDIWVDHYKISAFDTAELCRLLDITPEYIESQIKKTRKKPAPFLTQVSPEKYGRFMEKLYKFPGFYTEPRTLRKYIHDFAAHILGFVTEVDEKNLEEDDYYKMGDYIGKSGIEKSYEKVLRGRKGKKIYFVDVKGKIRGSYKNGRQDVESKMGSDLYCTIDAELQEYGESLMKRFRGGGIVAIEPSSGEILTLISAPAYKPSLLVGRVRSENYTKLQYDTLKPLFNRALSAQYPPGSTFKIINGLIGLQERAIGTQTTYYVDGGIYMGHKWVKDHVYGFVNLRESIARSSNAYFCHTFINIIHNPLYENIHEAYDNWHDHVIEFGYGKKLGLDLPNEKSGFIPTHDYFDNIYGRRGWKGITIFSMAIGQGEILITPLQMANAAAIVANKGYYYIPHIVKNIKGGVIDRKYNEKHKVNVDQKYFDEVIEGMDMVVSNPIGTAYHARLADIKMCGKTGTVQNPHGENHSVFIAFAPKENPKIAIAVYIENVGYGSTWAAPLAALMIEKYLKGEVTNKWQEQRFLNPEDNPQ